VVEAGRTDAAVLQISIEQNTFLVEPIELNVPVDLLSFYKDLTPNQKMVDDFGLGSGDAQSHHDSPHLLYLLLLYRIGFHIEMECGKMVARQEPR
jgi:hypothetical protein